MTSREVSGVLGWSTYVNQIFPQCHATSISTPDTSMCVCLRNQVTNCVIPSSSFRAPSKTKPWFSIRSVHYYYGHIVGGVECQGVWDFLSDNLALKVCDSKLLVAGMISYRNLIDTMQHTYEIDGTICIELKRRQYW